MNFPDSTEKYFNILSTFVVEKYDTCQSLVCHAATESVINTVPSIAIPISEHLFEEEKNSICEGTFANKLKNYFLECLSVCLCLCVKL